MADGSSGNQGQLFLWQCKYCPKTLFGVPPDSFDFCPKCGKEQKQDPPIPEILCVHPECKATLFSEKAEICHICKKPQQRKTADTPTDSSKSTEEHKLKIAQAVESIKKQQSQEAETATKMAASHGACETAGDQLAAEPQKGEAQIPPDTSTLKQGETPENPIVIDSTNATTPDKGTSAEGEATVTGPISKGVSKSDTEGTTEHAKDKGNGFQGGMSTNVNIDGQKTDKPPKETSSYTSDDPAATKEKRRQEQPSGDPKQNQNSGIPSPDSSKLVPDPNSTKSTGSDVPDRDLARMSIDDVRTQTRKRNFEGHEGDGECPPEETGGSSAPTTYAAVAKAPATTTQPSQTQSSVPPNKKPKNNTPNDSEPRDSSTDQENKSTHPPSSSNQSGDPQVCLSKCIHVIFVCSTFIFGNIIHINLHAM